MLSRSASAWRSSRRNFGGELRYPILFRFGPTARPEGADVLSAQGNALGFVRRRGCYAGPTGQPFSWTAARRTVGPLGRRGRGVGFIVPRALPWAGRTAAPLGRKNGTRRGTAMLTQCGDFAPFPIPDCSSGSVQPPIFSRSSRGISESQVRLGPLGPLLVVAKVIVDLLDVVEIIGQRSMNVGAGNAREHFHDPRRRMTAHLVPDNDVHHPDAVAGDARAAAAHAGCLGNVLRENVFHKSLPWSTVRCPFPL